jgi:hypothetical protein
MIGRIVISTERASANYCLRQCRRRRTGEITWEVVERFSGTTIAAGLECREEALRVVRGWERLGQEVEGGFEGHISIH